MGNSLCRAAPLLTRGNPNQALPREYFHTMLGSRNSPSAVLVEVLDWKTLLSLRAAPHLSRRGVCSGPEFAFLSHRPACWTECSIARPAEYFLRVSASGESRMFSRSGTSSTVVKSLTRDEPRESCTKRLSDVRPGTRYVFT